MSEREVLRAKIGADTDGAETSVDNLDSKIESIQSTAADASAALGGIGDGVKDAAGTAEEGSEDIQKAMRALGIQSDELAERQRKKLTDAYEAIRDSGVASADEKRRAYEKLERELFFLDKRLGKTDARFRISMKNVQTLSNGATGALKAMGKVAAIAGAAALAVGGLVGKSVKDAANYADEMIKLSRQTGIAVETLSSFKLAADQSGVSTSVLAKASTELNKKMRDDADIFKKLGINVRDASGEFRAIEDVMAQVAGKISNVGSQAERNALAMEVFGKATGPQLASFLALGEEGIRAYVKQAQDFGLVVTEEAGKAAEDFNDSLDNLTQRFKGLRQQASTPFFKAFADVFRTIGTVIDNNRAALLGFATMLSGKVLGVVEDFVSILSGNREAVNNAWILQLVEAAESLGTVFMTVVLPAIVGISSAISALVGDGTGLGAAIATVVAGLVLLGPVLGFVLNIVGLLIKAKPLFLLIGGAVGSIAVIPAVLIAVAVGLVVLIYKFRKEIWTFIKDMVSGIGDFFSSVGAGIAKVWDSVKSGLVALFKFVVLGYLQFWLTVFDAIYSVVPTVKEALGRAWLAFKHFVVNVKDGFFNLFRSVRDFIVSTLLGALTAVLDRIKAAIDLVRSIPSRITGAIKGGKAAAASVNTAALSAVRPSSFTPSFESPQTSSAGGSVVNVTLGGEKFPFQTDEATAQRFARAARAEAGRRSYNQPRFV